jgi:RHS repeat-associated protein
LRWKWDQAEPFGATTPDENPLSLGAFELPLRFPGQYADKETGLAQNWFRDFDGSIGRYTQADPIGLAGLLYGRDAFANAAGSLDLYSYVTAQPVRLSDPNGLEVAEGPAGPYSKEPEAYGNIPRGPSPNQKAEDTAGRYDICPVNLLRKPCKWCVDYACNFAGQSSKVYCCEVDRRKCIAGAVDDPAITGRCNAQYATCVFRGGKK